MATSSQIVLNSFRKIVRAIRLNSKQLQKDMGITSAQYYVLQNLVPSEWVSINDIAARTNTDQSSVSVVVKKLIEEKLLLKKTNPEDRRSVLISPSLIGLRYTNTKKPLIQNQIMQGIRSLTQLEQDQLAMLMSKLLEGANLHHGDAAMFMEEGGGKKRGPKPKAKSIA